MNAPPEPPACSLFYTLALSGAKLAGQARDRPSGRKSHIKHPEYRTFSNFLEPRSPVFPLT